ncbi:hypothetical protein ACFRAE_02705 [Sphingobacterium sp. HJSM2_6]|uniref:hypothetical protein n=1 Tax=Sphingobacterium sp. HJSM2_6 TaxID=3366264 RepID=UPI003BBCEEBF
MNRLSIFYVISIFSFLLTSCSVVEGIFKVGMWFGILVVVAIVALIIWLISKFSGGSPK